MKAKKQSNIKKFKFNKFLEIGAPDAETDKLLEKSFIENDAFHALLDMENQRSIIIGRTGSGKSAILKQIEVTQERVCRIQPEAMSLRFLSNSTMLDYFKQLNVNLNFFYKILWKHVFVIELLRLHFDYNNQKKTNWFSSIKESLLQRKFNPKKAKALEYFDKWSREFWLDTEQRVKEIENTVHKKFEAEIGANIHTLKAKLNSNTEDKDTTKFEIKNKAEHVISETLANDIHEMINILREEIFINKQQKHFILIDDLDKEWIPTSVRYDLIAAMIEVIKEFQSLAGVKIVISLRDNLYQLIFAGASHKGGQREKFKPLYVDLTWTKLELQEFLNRRLFLITAQSLDIKSAFDKNYKHESGFDYMIDRTFFRPRDVISFVNHAIECANNKTSFSFDILKRAEIGYSRDRLTAVEDEWGENFGEINLLFKFLYGKYNGFRVRNIKEDDFYELYYLDTGQLFKGELADVIGRWQKDQIKFIVFIKEVLYWLYTFGIIGLKKNPTEATQFFYTNNLTLSPNDIAVDCKVYVHKAFYSALKINTKELEDDSYGTIKD